MSDASPLLKFIQLTEEEDVKLQQVFGYTTLKQALLDYAELYAPTRTRDAKAVMFAFDMTSGKQLLHAALVAFLSRPPFLSDDEEKQFIEACRLRNQI